MTLVSELHVGMVCCTVQFLLCCFGPKPFSTACVPCSADLLRVVAVTMPKRQTEQSWDNCTVPARFVQAVNAARVPCTFYSRGMCRKGMKCPRLHGQPADRRGSCVHLPHISRFRDSTGRDLITLRPPLHDAWTAYFNYHAKPKVVGASATENYGSDNVITYELTGMKEPNWKEITEATVAKGVRINGKPKWQSDKAMPAYLAHGTGIGEGLAILLDGRILPSPGIAGTGIYAFEVHEKLFRSEDYRALWDRTRSGGYNFGCLIVLWLLSG
jgi:hypothetical protein